MQNIIHSTLIATANLKLCGIDVVRFFNFLIELQNLKNGQVEFGNNVRKRF